MSTVYVVLGMHRSGTSLVSSMLHAAGIPMCRHTRCNRRTPSQPQGHWEDNAFLALNRRILYSAKGNWKRPPDRNALQSAADKLYPDMVKLVALRSQGVPVWGWKEPRTTLLAHLWHQVLVEAGHDPRYAICTRPQAEIVRSLIRRNKGGARRWRRLCNAYMLAIFQFICDYRPEQVLVSFKALTSGDTHGEALALAQFAGVEDRVGDMVSRVKRRGA